MDISLADLEASLTQQLQDITTIAADVGVPLTHIKPHGALYNDAQDDPQLSTLLVDLADRANLALVGMPGSLVQQQAIDKGISFIGEAFIDRQYRSNGRLVPRSETGAVIADEGARIDQGIALATGTPFPAQNQTVLTIEAQTICLHSDSDGALETAKRMRAALEQAGIMIGQVR